MPNWIATKPGRKLAAGVLLAWGVGGVLAYLLMGGVNDAAPPWVVLWCGTVAAFLWAYIIVRAVRWAWPRS